MKSIQAMLAVAVVCLLIVGGAFDAARADDRDKESRGVTLYTSRSRADHFICVAVNVSDKTLGISFAVNDVNGNALSCASPTTCNDTSGNATTNPTPEFGVLPGTSVSLDILLPLGMPNTGYCSIAVSGTGNRDDVRASLKANLTDVVRGTSVPFTDLNVEEAH
jgi:hypothetical protein